MTKSTKGQQQRNGHTKTGTAVAVSSASTHATVKGSNKSDKKGKGDEIKDKTTSSPSSATNGKIKNRPSPSVKSGTANEATSRKNPKSGEQNGNSAAHNNNSADHQMKKMKEADRLERENIVLWKRPITTLHYFTIELCLDIKEYAIKIWGYKLSVFFSLVLLMLSVVAYYTPGPHQSFLFSMEKQAVWCLYWLGLGVLSSVGLGTGLHTFLLYLGPHIAAVTLAAYECGTLDFPSPPYPDSIICPENDDSAKFPVTLWSIMSKVRLEAMMWGAGTALGELPPYFMARAARLSTLASKGKHHQERRRSSLDLDDDMEELVALKLKEQNLEKMTLLDRAKLGVERMVERVGFFGILACASIPNPLFDLAGITCGHFLVPFWTFFGATLIGKAIIKTHLQQLTVIVAFNENLVSKLVTALAKVPVVGSRLQEPLEQLLKSQKAKLHSKEGKEPSEGGSILASLFEKLVMAMVIYFVISIVNSLAQNYHQRLHSRKQGANGLSRSRIASVKRGKNQTIAKQA